MKRGLRSAVVVEVPEVPPQVACWLETTARAKPSRGVAPHVTVLFPFVPAADLHARTIDALQSLAGGFEPFAYELRELRRWPRVLYLAPEPATPFLQLTDAFVAAFPEYPPYEGAHEAVVPHLTVAEGDPEMLAAAEDAVRPSLPVRAAACELTVLAERAAQAWVQVTRLPLGRRA